MSFSAFAQIVPDGTNISPQGTDIKPIRPSDYTDTKSITTLDLQNPLGTTSTFSALLETIINWLITLGGVLATFMIVVGALQMVFSGGDEDRFKTGKNTILYTAIGYGIILLAWSIASLVENILKL